MKKFAASPLLVVTLCMLMVKAHAQTDPIEKLWYNGDKTSKIQIYKGPDGSYWGKIYWLKEPLDKDTGKPKLDKENPDEKLRSTPVQDMVIMKGFKKNPEKKEEYIDGSIYDPKKGKIYCGKVTFNGNSLDLRGYICHFSFLGRTETWDIVEGQ
jgi:uncharacterized protein (DUF2147 family)